MKKILSFFLLSFLIFSTEVTYAAKSWKIIPEKSKLTFTAIQNNSPVTGQFKNFSGDIVFDPNDLRASHLNIHVDINSVSTSYATVADTLKSTEWFDAKQFSQAVFTAENFVKTGNNTYDAVGSLTIRNKSQPVTLHFVLEQFSDSGAHVKGNTEFGRTQFNVGTGEWAKTDAIKDNVKVNFDISAVPM